MSLIAELKRRNVFKVGVAYIVVVWLTLQVIDVSIQLMGLPDWIGRALVLILAVGFPFALIFAWAFELTPEGIKKESEVDRSESITDITGRKLDFAIIAVLAAAVVFFAVDKYVLTPDVRPPTKNSAAAGATANDALTGDRQTVAVVPFVDMSPQRDQGWIADIIATEMQTELSKRSDLSVLSRSSSFAIPNDLLSSQDIGRYLGVDVLVEGTVRRMGDRIRVTVQLVTVGDGYQLWSDVYESRLSNDFSAEVAVAEFFSSQVREQLASPFSPNIQITQFADAADSGFTELFSEQLLIKPASAAAPKSGVREPNEQ